MGQSYDRPGGGGQGGYVLPKPTPPPRQGSSYPQAEPSAPMGTLRGGLQAPDYRDEPTNQEPSASRLPPVKPPPKKMGSAPELPPYGASNGQAPNGYGNGHAPPARGSLPAVSPPPRRSVPAPSPSLSDSITDLHQPHAPRANDTVRDQTSDLQAQPLDWSDEEESTSVYANHHGSQPPPADDLSATVARGAPPPPPSSARMSISGRPPASVRAPRIVPPAPSRSTLLGVHPNDLAPRPPSRSNAPAAYAQTATQAPYSQPGAPPPPVPVFPESQAPRPTGMSHAGPAPAAPNEGGAHASAPPPAMTSPQAQSLGTNGSLGAMHGSNGAMQAANGAVQGPHGAMQGESPFARLATARPNQATELSLRRASLSGAEPAMPESNTGKMAIAIALVTALVTAAAAGTFFFLRRPGGLEVDVRDTKGASVSSLAVYVDGRKVCEATPCVVRDLDPGSKAVRVVAPGFADEEPQTTVVAAGATNKLAIVLKPSFGTLAASSEQAGLRIAVDGTERGPLPARLADLTPGVHQIRITGGDRYKALEKPVEVKIGEQVDLGDVKLEVIRGKMTVSVKTDGAQILLIPNDDQSKAKSLDGPFPRAVEVETNSGSWKLVAKKKGFPDFVAPLDFSDGIAEKTLDVVFSDAKSDKDKDKDKEPPKDDAAIKSSSNNTPSPTPSTPPKGNDTPPPSSTDNSASNASTGTLNINSIPPSRILLDGQPMGETPKTVQVSPGTHTVTFVHPELGKKSVSVSIKAGETKSAGAKLRTD